MYKLTLIIVISLFVVVCATAINYPENGVVIEEPVGTSMTSLEAKDESLEAFNTMMDVLTHQRCVNCHPSDNIPKQGEDRHHHRFGIVRGNVGNATNCNTCHQASNNEFSGVPGAPDWSLAPHSMRWEGLSRTEIAQSMMNPETNGNRTAEDIMHHLTEHELVLWAWEPGIGVDGEPRELPPVGKEEYIEAVKTWIELGAIIPEEE
ncbi:MAG: hypothetical protein AAFQ98_12605 [Bacteroidota bacterium]